MYSNIEMNILD